MWQPILVIAWIQFAVGAAVILGATSLALRWIAQPAERARLVQLMLASVLALPVLSALAPFPSWNLGWISRASVATAPSNSPLQLAPEQEFVTPTNISSDEGVRQPNAADEDVREAQPVLRSEPAEIALSPQAIVGRAPSVDIWAALAWAIIAAHTVAAIYILAQRAIAQTRLHRLRRAASEAPDTVVRAWLAIVGNRAAGVRLLVSTEVDAPLVFGCLRPVVVVPKEIAAQSGRTLDCCLAHEWSHIERADMLTWSFVNLCQLALWYQPAFWSLRRELRLCQEFLADHRCVQGVSASVEYSELLLGLARRRIAPGVAGALNMFDQPSQLARRIKMLLEERIALSLRCRRPFTCSVLAVAALLAIASSTVRVDSIQADVEAAQPAAATPPAVAPADDEKPAATMITYTELSNVKGQNQPVKTKEFIAPDGRRRTEMALGMTTVFDADRRIRLSLLGQTKTAMVYGPGEAMRHPIPSFMEWFKRLRTTSDKLVKELGRKEIDAKHVSGFVSTQGDLIYTVWTDEATELPVRIETDFLNNGAASHKAMTDFRFDEKLDESLFSFEVPAGYKLWKGPAIASFDGGQQKPPAEKAAELELAWSREGQWVAVAAVKGEPAVYGIYRLQSVIKLNEKGEELGTTRLVSSDFHIRAADLSADKDCDFITYTSGTVTAYSPSEKVLWYYSKQGGMGDVCVADLNNDAVDEAILCYTGFSGIHALDNTGKLLWKNTGFGNVWHVAAGNVEGDARPEILAAVGTVHVLSADGKLLRDLNPGFNVNQVRVWENAAKDASAAVIVAAGTDATRKTTVGGMNSAGAPQWSFELAARVENAVTSGQQPWAALTLADGTVHVIDVLAGSEIGQIGSLGERTDVAWLPIEKGDPLLVVATSTGLNAYRVPAVQP